MPTHKELKEQIVEIDKKIASLEAQRRSKKIEKNEKDEEQRARLKVIQNQLDFVDDYNEEKLLLEEKERLLLEIEGRKRAIEELEALLRKLKEQQNQKRQENLALYEQERQESKKEEQQTILYKTKREYRLQDKLTREQQIKKTQEDLKQHQAEERAKRAQQIKKQLDQLEKSLKGKSPALIKQQVSNKKVALHQKELEEQKKEDKQIEALLIREKRKEEELQWSYRVTVPKEEYFEGRHFDLLVKEKDDLDKSNGECALNSLGNAVRILNKTPIAIESVREKTAEAERKSRDKEDYTKSRDKGMNTYYYGKSIAESIGLNSSNYIHTDSHTLRSQLANKILANKDQDKLFYVAVTNPGGRTSHALLALGPSEENPDNIVYVDGDRPATYRKAVFTERVDLNDKNTIAARYHGYLELTAKKASSNPSTPAKQKASSSSILSKSAAQQETSNNGKNSDRMIDSLVKVLRDIHSRN